MGQEGRPGSDSLPFDRIAADYDRTRALPRTAMRKMMAVLSQEVRERQPCLEIGVGTGRIALPLSQFGVRMVGIDLSGPMLGRLVEKGGGAVPFPLARADAVRLPFEDGAFGAALAMHVLHVVGSWREVLGELTRAVRPGGVVVVDVGGWGPPWSRCLRDRFVEETGVSRGWPGTNSLDEVDRAMTHLRARPRDLPAIFVQETTTIAEQVGRIEAGVHSFTWQVDEATRRKAAAAMRRWAQDRFGSLDRPRRLRRRLQWRAYDVGKH